MTIFECISNLVEYGIESQLIQEADAIYTRNQLLEIFDLKEFTPGDYKTDNHFEILKDMVDYAFDQNIIESNKPPYSDLFESKVMNVLMPKPSEIINNFNELYKENPIKATDYYYDLSKKSHYIRLDRTSKNMVWKVESVYGDIDITVNLSKPEKDPKAIAAAAKQKSALYPKCFLCKENEGYAGHISHPGRHNHRIVPMMLNQEDWFLQYSPYAYFNEHAIVLKKGHDPMTINGNTFSRLLDFVDQYPHYFIGSNADLPIVGGSMLSHDHYQAGRYEFPMERASVIASYNIKGVDAHYLNWPLTVIRLESDDKQQLLQAGEAVFESWLKYDDESLEILSHTDARHNTVTPIARVKDGKYQLDLVLRNNRTNDTHTLGIFHPHAPVHPVKKENIGLIEVMGLAVLPSRLKDEMAEMARVVYEGLAIPESLMIFADIMKGIPKGDTLEATHEHVLNVVGVVFTEGLEDSGVFKCNDAGKAGLERFINTIK